MFRSEMNKVIARINEQQKEVERWERACDRAFDRGDLKKVEQYEERAHYEAGVKNGMILAMSALGFRIEPKPGTKLSEYRVDIHDELKLR